MLQYQLPDIDWPSVMPIVVVVCTGIVALIIEMIVPRRNNNVVVAVSLIGLSIAAYTMVPLFGMEPGTTFAQMVTRDHVGSVLQLLLIGVTALSFLFSEKYLREKGIAFAEFYPLAMWATAGGMIMVGTNSLLMMFLGLEVLSIALYCLAGMSRKEQRSEESALKYFLLGAFASAFFLYGVAFVFGASGTVDLSGIAKVQGLPYDQYTALAVLGVVLMIVGLGFKTSLAPFHQWTPDVYQGAPTNVTAFMASVTKIAAFGAFYRVLVAAVSVQEYWFPILFWMAVLTMLVGNVFAIAQQDVKRILAYSSVAHAGYVMVALLAHVKAPDSVPMDAVLYYLLVYSLMTVGAFAVVTLAAKGGREHTNLRDLNGLWKRSPLAAITLMIFMFSLVGLPPTAGFFGKYMIFASAVDADLMPLAIVLAVSSAISVYYYLGIVQASMVDEESAAMKETAKMSPGLALTCIICAAGVFATVVFARPVIEFIQQPESDVIPVEATFVPEQNT